MSYTPIDQIASPLPGMDQDEFDSHVAAYHRQLPTFVDQANAAGVQTDNNRAASAASATASAASATAAATSAADAASAAAAASIAANVTKWVSGATYADGAVVWSPLTTYPYRRIGAGAGTTDPSIDTSHYALQLFGLGLGGTAITGGATFTANSPAAVMATPAEPGLYAILADATTCLKSALQQSVYNAGEYDYGIKDASGNVLGWVRPGATAIVGLVDNSTAAGVWMISGLSKTAVTAQYSSPSLTYSGGAIRRVTLDSTRTLLVLAAGTGIYALVYDSSTRTWTSTLVRAPGSGSAYFGAVLSAANQVLLVSIYGSDFEAMTLTVSGSAVVPNTGTKLSITLSTSSTIQSNPVPVGSSWVLPILEGGWSVRAISVSGTAPAVGSAVSIGGGPELRVFASGSVARVVAITSSVIICTPYTVSGSSLTPGTAASAASDTGAGKVVVNGNGNIVALYSSTTLRAAVFKLTGTTEAVTTVEAVPASYTGSSNLSLLEMGAISAGKTVFYSPATQDKVGIITDSAGTASVGTTWDMGAASSARAFLGMNGTTARFAFQVNSNPASHLVQFDCSGASPNLLPCALTGLSTAPAQSTSADGTRSPFLLTVGSGANSVAYTISASGTSAPQGQYTTNRVRANAQLALQANTGAPGAANDSWLLGGGAYGINIYHVEAVA